MKQFELSTQKASHPATMPQVPPLNIFHTAAMLANELHSPSCVNWHALEAYNLEHGKDKTLAAIADEKIGANNIYAMHLELAESAINSTP